MKTRLLSLLLLIASAAFPATAYDFMVNGLCYNKNSDGNSVTVTYENSSNNPSYNSLSGALTIPSSVTYSGKTYSVKAIGESAFERCANVTSVTVPTSVTSMGGDAFFGCDGLTKVNISDLAKWCNIDFDDYWSNPLYFAKNLYVNGSKVTSLTIPSSITNIKNCTFAGCNMTQLTIPSTVKTIGYRAFAYCNGLKTVTIPNSVTEIGWSAFSNCTGITSATIGNSVKTITEKAFTGCTALTSVTIPNSVTSIGVQAFSYCSGLTSLTIGSGVTSIAWLAFHKCTNLTTVYWNATNYPEISDSSDAPFEESTSVTSMVIGNNVTRIPAYLCYNLTGMTSVTIGNAVTEIGANAFSGCIGLNRVNISNLAAWCNINFGGQTNNPLYYAQNLYLSGTKVTNLTIPSTITNIKPYSFINCTCLTQLTIPSAVTSIGFYAFAGCSNLVTVNWNAANCDDFSSNYYAPFPSLYNIKYINFGSTVKRIPAYLCYYLNALTSVSIPSSVKTIGEHAFAYCSGLKKVETSSLAAWCGINFGNYYSNPLYIAKNLYLNGSKITNLVIPSSVSNIKPYVFYNCSSLTSLTIPNTVTSIDSYAFSGCNGITSLNIPSSVTTIGMYAFSQCTGMSLLTIPNSITSFGEYAFYGCSGLSTIRSKLTAPQNVSYGPGSSIFYGSPKTCTVYVPKNTLSSYQAVSHWNYFNHIVEVDYELIEQLDVNGDGWVSSADVTMLYDYLLGESAEDFPEGDVDGDGYVTSADVTALYNYILGNE